MGAPLRIGQVGTKHGHAAGKWKALLSSPNVEAVGIWEPDAEARAARQADGSYPDARWCASADELLGDPNIVALAIEGQNDESLGMAHRALDAGKHLWYDKPAGDDWPGFQDLMAKARRTERYVQMGYMFRYQPGFGQIMAWAKSGALGDVYGVRAHMSMGITVQARAIQSVHVGGIFYDLGGHMLDQVVWLLGRPTSIMRVFRNDATPEYPSYVDNAICVFEFERAMAFVDISSLEPRPPARRFEIYGTRGTAITEPFDHARVVTLTLGEAWGDYAAGTHTVEPEVVPRQQMYEREIAAFVGVLRGERPPDRTPEHELLVQETLLRATGRIPV